MAFFAKATSESDKVLPSNITICPLCEDEYDDPKRLPCMHTICLGCLESVVPQNSLILQCPIDNQELPMPKGGVNALPSDMRIVRLLELTSGDQTAKKTPRTTKKKSKSSEGDNDMNRRKSVSAPAATSLEEESEMVKKLISEAVNKIREALTAKEKEMLQEVDDVVKKELRKRASTASYSSESDMVESPSCNGADSVFEDAVENKNKNEPKDGPKGKAKPPVPPKRPPSFILDLTPSRKMLQMAKEEGLGKLQYGRKMAVASSEQSTPAPIASSTPTYGGAAEVVSCINLPNRYKRTFNPTAVAASHDGHVAISDYGSECVLLFDPDWNFIKKIGEGDCNKAGLEGPDGLAFLPNNNLVVADSPLDGVQTLKLYDPEGNYLKTIVEQDEAEVNDNILFGRIVSDPDGRIILACSGDDPFVRVYDIEGNLQLEFGDGILQGPQKALYHDNKYFVSDSNVTRHICNIKMFDKAGKFLCMFDDQKLNVGEQDSMGLDVTYPIQITCDRGTILAYHGLNKSLRLYKTDGSFVIEFRTVTGIRDIAVNEVGNIIASCGEDSMLPRSVQILRY